MQFGVREICDVVLKAKANQKVGNRIFYRNEPVLYFDTLTTSSMEGAATTVYAQGGRGNARLISWDGERTVTFNMTDALLSPESFSILSGAGLINGADEEANIIVHQTERIEITEESEGAGVIAVSNKPYIPDGSKENFIYVMVLDGAGQVNSEPYLYDYTDGDPDEKGLYPIVLKTEVACDSENDGHPYAADNKAPKLGDVVLVDYYSKKVGSGVYQIDITPDKFGGAYYLEASTLFRDRATGQDMPAEFIIPNCRIQSNFTFTMASSGDPSTFDFVIDAFPDYTRFNRTQKVLAEIQIVGVEADDMLTRISTKSTDKLNSDGIIVDPSTLIAARECEKDDNGVVTAHAEEVSFS